MNREQIEGKWTEIKGQLRKNYGTLTDDEIEEAKGDRDRIEGMLQRKLGKSKAEVRGMLDDILEQV